MPSDTQAIRRSPLLRLVEISAVLLFVCFAVLRLVDTFVGHDQSWYLVAAERFLDGAKLYSPMIRETNPPLIMWFSTLPVLLFRWTHLLLPVCFYLIVLGAILCCLFWSFRLLRLSVGQIVPLFPALFACASIFVLFHIEPEDFGQREQLLVALMLPYILATASGAVSRLGLAERSALGLVAALGTCFKPHYALVFVALELTLAAYNRTLRRIFSPELLTLIFTCFLYLALVRVLTPEYGRETVPVLFDTYWAYGTESAIVLILAEKTFLVAGSFILLITFFLRKHLYVPQLTMALIVCSLTGIVSYAVQHTGWGYHKYPHHAFLYLGELCLAIDFFCRFISRSQISSRFTVPLFRLLLLVEVCLMALFLWHRIPTAVSVSHPDVDRFFAQYKPHTRVLVLSTALGAFSNASYHQLTWSSGYANLWLLPAVLQNERGRTEPPVAFRRLSPQTVERLANMQRSEIAHDLDQWKPSVILVQRCTKKRSCQGLEGKDVDVAAWFMQSAEFSSAWSHYQLRSGAPEPYDLYTRIP